MTRKQPKVTLRFEGLAFQVDLRPDENARTVARAVLRRVFPARGWTLSPLNPRTAEFEARPAKGRRRLDVGAAWSASYRLRAAPRVIYSEPLFELPNDAQFPPPKLSKTAGGGGESNDPGTEANFEWSLESMHVPEAWALFSSTTPGDGVVVAHPDTGYTAHPEIIGTRLRVADGYDFEDDKSDPSDPLADGWLRNPGHGTSTSSVIMSSRGQQGASNGPEFVSGSAPGASLIPIRTTKSVVIWSMSRLTKAIYHAIAKKAHVVSISLGGPFGGKALHNAVREAQRQGIIVLCAAGNKVGFVVFPAAFDEVIAVAASRIDDETWSGSCHGAEVDITAPGSSVWRAHVEKDKGVLTFDVSRSSGTSYAVASAAGVAALWLSFHGRAALIAKYGLERVPTLFKQLLQSACRTPKGWDTREFGPGIVQARRLLEAALPAHVPPPTAQSMRRRPVSDDRQPLELLVHLLAPARRSEVVRVLASFLRVDEGALPDALQDVGDELALQVAVDPKLRGQLKAAAGGLRATAKSRASAGPRPRRAPKIANRSANLRRYLTQRLGM